jgi:hypothetical protein
MSPFGASVPGLLPRQVDVTPTPTPSFPKVSRSN